MKRPWIETHSFSEESVHSFPFKFETLEHKNAYDPSELHRHSYYEVFLFQNGGGTHLLDFEEIPIKDQSVHFLTPGMVHCVRRALNSDGFVLMFTDEFYYSNSENKNLLLDLPFFHNNGAHPVFTPNDDEFELLCKLAMEIKSVYLSQHTYRLNLLQPYIHIFLLRCLDAYEKMHLKDEVKSQSPAVVLNKFKKLLETNFIKSHQVKDYAGMMSITPNHLNNLCKQSTGKTASDMIQARLILEAKRLLAYSMKSAKEVSFELNFDSPSHFNKFFKNKTGKTPSEFVKGYEFVNRLA